MPTLADQLLTPDRRDNVVSDIVKLIEKQIDGRGPVRRLTLKAGMAMLNSVRPNGLHWAVGHLLPDFVEALEPFHQRFLGSGETDFSAFLKRHSEEAVAAMLTVTDARAGRVNSAGIRAGYQRMRPTAESEVRDALPGLALILGGYLKR